MPILDDDPMYDELVLWIVRQAFEKLAKSQQAEVKRIFALLAKLESGKKLSKAEEKALDCDEDATGLSDSEIVVSGLKMYAVKGSRRAACAAARLLGSSFSRWARPRARTARRHHAALATKAPSEERDHGEPLACTHRAKISHRIVGIADGKYGLIAKTKGK